MKLINHARIAFAVFRYDFWLEMRGVRAPRRRELRSELRANLTDAARDHGVTAALVGIGSPKALAYAVTDGAESRPRWSAGLLVATAVATVMVVTMGLSASAFFAGVEATRTQGTTSGFAFPWFGAEFEATVEPSAVALGVSGQGVGIYLILVPLLAFVFVAAPWRLLRRHKAPSTAQS